MHFEESSSVELKERITKTFLKTVSAFANYHGGSIVFGVNDNGKVVGLDNLSQASLTIEQLINDSISPCPFYQIEENQVNKTIHLHIQPGDNPPYLYKSKAYKRNNTSTVEVDNVQMRDLLLKGSNQTFDEIFSPIEAPTFNTLQTWFSAHLNIEEINDDMLKSLGLLSIDGKHYTNAGALFADNNSFYGIDMARFGDSISEIFNRTTTEHLSILTLFTKALDFYKLFCQYEAIKGVERVQEELIPQAAFREAIANALVHRRWDIKAHIRIFLFEDRIEIMSPGELPYGITQQDYLEGTVSFMRNPTIANIFFRLNLIESFGTGIRRIKEAYLPFDVSPEFEISDNSVKVLLPMTNKSKGFTDEEKNILDKLEKSKGISSSNLVDETKYGKDKVLRILRTLEEKNVIKKVGAGRSTRYLAC